jgi:hypothetical protein
MPARQPRFSKIAIAAAAATGTLASGGPAPVGPDLIVGELAGATTFGVVDGTRALAFGFVACNTGDEPVGWFNATPAHPVFATQLYRLADGRFEQIGLSFVFHEFFPLQSNACGDCSPPANPQTLGVGCSTVNTPNLAGARATLGPRTEVDPVTGVFPFPFTDYGLPLDAMTSRLQARETDLLIPGARYFVEGLYVAPDDADAGNADNNASHREAVFPAGAGPLLIGETARERPAIHAWADADPGVFIAEADAPDGGRYIVASRATPLATGEWRYEYAVYNQNAARSAASFAAPHLGRTDYARAFDLGFHDVDYHSGEPVDGTDWAGAEAVFDARWTVVPPAPLAALPNEIRWGTLYNFGFTSFDPPVQTTVRVGFDDPPASIRVPALAAGLARCSAADFAEPFSVLDLADIQAFIALFGAGAPGADIAPPLGVLDLADVQAFIGAFVGGCDL